MTETVEEGWGVRRIGWGGKGGKWNETDERAGLAQGLGSVRVGKLIIDDLDLKIELNTSLPG